jgi:hydrogenase maturation protease
MTETAAVQAVSVQVSNAPRGTECDEQSAHSVVLVLGVGNPLRGDDGVGPRVIQELEDRRLPEEVETLDAGTGGLDLLHLIEGRSRVIIVDAADVDRVTGPTAREQIAPGEFIRFTPDQVHLVDAADRLSFHHAGLAEVLALARALDRPLPPIVVFGVQPGDVGWGQGLSPAVEAGLPALIRAVLQEISGE